MSVFIGLALAVIVPLLFLGIIRKLDFYQTGQFKLILSSLGGGVVAYVLASVINISMEYFGSINRNTIILFYAPILEEIFKGLVLLILIKRSQITYSVDGALYGFAAGVGFAVSENFGYILSNLAEAAEISVYRVGTANLVHASSSAIVGIALGMIHLRRNSLRWLAFALGLFLAIGQHMFYNSISLGKNSLGVAVGIGVLGVLFVFFAMQLGKKRAGKWIKQKLGIIERITRGEIAAIEHLARTEDLLLPVYERFGADKTIQVEKLLYLESRLGIKRKALDNLQEDDFLRNALKAEIDKMRTEIDAARRMVGIYVMLFVRGLYTEEVASIWDHMQAKIRVQSALNDGQKGGGLWSSLEERVNTPTDAERHK